ncbi:MAG TPA: alpha/beta fold hydrolase [Thermoanaerobaculia bacterium]|nr:alpha/beta fold hydrolase [Thermoanaerobaculia bacterium]
MKRIDSLLVVVVLFVAASIRAAAPTPAERGQTFDTGGVKIWYEVRGGGQGTPLVLVNGGPGFDHTYLHLSDVWDRLAQTRPVVFYDQRGNGSSSALAKDQSCTLADQIADLDALRAHLGADKIDLLGHSWGGYLVMAYASRHPKHIRRLIICDSAAPKWSDTRFLFDDIFPETVSKQNAVAFAESLGDKSASDESIALYLTMLFYSPEKRDAAQPRLKAAVYKKEINEALNHDVGRFDLNPELPRFAFPTLVLTGRYDINVAPSVAWKIHRAVPGSRFAVFERSGHLPFYEEPDAFLDVVRAFLDEK